MLFNKSRMLEKMDEFKLDALVLATAAGKRCQLLAPPVVDKSAIITGE